MNYSLGNMLGRTQQLGKPFDWNLLRDGMTPRRGTVAFTRASTGTFIDPSTSYLATAAINAARIESDGLLIEPQRTNLVINSNPSDANWSSLTNVTKSSNAHAAPNGLTDAAVITETTANGQHAVFLPATLNSAPSVDYAVSFYAKPLGSRNLYHASEFNTLRNATLNASTNAVVGGTGVLDAVSVSAPNGFWRVCYKTQSAYVVTQSARPFLGLTTATNVPSTFSYPSYVGSVSESAAFWGMQIELGSTPTSLILTTGASATRSADVCTLTIPSGVSSLGITYGDDTTDTVSVTPGGSYQLPASQKKYKSIIAL